MTGHFLNSTTNSTIESTMKYRRDSPANILLTVYGDLDEDAPPPGAPAMGGNRTLGSEDAGGLVVPRQPIEPVTAVVMVTSAVTVTYTTVCATNPAKLIALQHCTTMAMAGSACTAAPVPSGAPYRNAAVAPYGNTTNVSLANDTSVSFDGTGSSFTDGTGSSFTDGTRVPYLNNTQRSLHG